MRKSRGNLSKLLGNITPEEARKNLGISQEFLDKCKENNNIEHMLYILELIKELDADDCLGSIEDPS